MLRLVLCRWGTRQNVLFIRVLISAFERDDFLLLDWPVIETIGI